MAEYIRGEILAQSYVNLYKANYRRVPTEEVRNDLERRANELAARIFDFEVRIEVSLTEGSLTVVTTVWVVGSLLLKLYHAIAEYGSFRSGIKVIVDDVKKFGRHQNESTKATVAPYDNSPSHVEARLGFPGALKRLTDELFKLSQNKQGSSAVETSRRLKELIPVTKSLLSKIEADKERERLATILTEFVKGIFPERPVRRIPAKESLQVLAVPPRQLGVNRFIAAIEPKPKELDDEEKLLMLEEPRKQQTIQIHTTNSDE